MRRIRAAELLLFLLGLSLLFFNFYVMEIPPSLRRVNIVESYALKTIIIAAGLGLILFSLISFSIKRSLCESKAVKKAAWNLALLAGSIVVCLALLEIFLNFSSPQSCQQPDPVTHHSYRPGCKVNSKSAEWDISVQINSAGLRDDPVLPKEQYDGRILMLGDSFTVGWGVPHSQTFSEILQQQFLAKNWSIDVLNGGSTSYSPVLEYLFLKEKVASLDPDIVILNLDIGDIQNDVDYLKLARFSPSGEIQTVSGGEQQNFLYWIYSKLKIIKLLESPLIILDSAIPSTRLWGASHFYDLKYDQYLLTREGLTKQEILDYLGPTLKYIQLINDLSIRNNITFVLSTYPYGHQVSGEEWKRGRHNFGFATGKIYSSYSNRILEEWAAEKGILFISMLEDFKRSSEHQLFYPYDGHFNENGHRLAGSILFSKLMELNVVPDKLPATKKLQATNKSDVLKKSPYDVFRN